MENIHRGHTKHAKRSETGESKFLKKKSLKLIEIDLKNLKNGK